MAMMVLDPMIEKQLRDEWEASGATRFEECWNGLSVIPPLPDNDHQGLVADLMYALMATVQDNGKVFPGVNVSDLASGWTHNYRGPDVVVYLKTNPAINHGTHWEGGPDLLVEIISPGEEPHVKFDFYAKVHTREVLIVERDPWALELFQLQGKALVSAGRSEIANPLLLASNVLPLTFQLQPMVSRSRIEVHNTQTGQRWMA